LPLAALLASALALGSALLAAALALAPALLAAALTLTLAALLAAAGALRLTACHFTTPIHKYFTDAAILIKDAQPIRMTRGPIRPG
jgi:hypothetical protein